jgi:hypothetical protein
MPTLTEGRISYEFNGSWIASKYDDWVFYRNKFHRICDNKAVDFIAYNPGDKTLWLIEIKDYRFHRREKKITLVDEIAMKVRDTLAGLFVARINTHPEKGFAIQVSKAMNLRVILHLEQPDKPSRLMPTAYKVVDVQQKLKNLLKTIDPHLKVINNSSPDVPWSIIII